LTVPFIGYLKDIRFTEVCQLQHYCYRCRTWLNAISAAGEAERNIIDVASLVAADRKRLLQSPKAGPASYRLFEMLPMMPRFTIERVRKQLDTSFPTATAAVKALEDLGIVAEMTGQKKNRSYSYQAYVEVLSR
jgi:hypothetical protein